MDIAFNIPGEPVGKGRPRFGSGHAYTPAKTARYEKLVKEKCIEAMGEAKVKAAPKGTPVYVRIEARYGIAKSDSLKVKNKKLCDDIMPSRKKPDIDNVAKIVLDALNRVAWEDDAQVVYLIVYKTFFTEPCVRVEIRTRDEETES